MLAAGGARDPAAGLDDDLVSIRRRMMADRLLMAVACDQTRVFNLFYAAAFSATTKPGYDKPHHTATHEEAVDAELGYQPNTSWFTRRAMEEWAWYVQRLADFREGDGTLLDHSFIYATTDQSFAKMHAIDGIPMFSAGNAFGRVRTGLHVDGAGSPGCRLGTRRNDSWASTSRPGATRATPRLMRSVKSWSELRHSQRRCSRRFRLRRRRGRGPRSPHEAWREVPMPPGFQVVITETEGPLFADAEGRTLYKWPHHKHRNGYSGETPGNPACYDEVITVTAGLMSPYPPGIELPEVERRPSCAELWPPVLAAADDLGVGDWSIVERRDGTLQWAYEEQPLYRSIRDAQSGDVLGARGAATGEILPPIASRYRRRRCCRRAFRSGRQASAGCSPLTAPARFTTPAIR